MEETNYIFLKMVLYTGMVVFNICGKTFLNILKKKVQKGYN